MGLIHSKCIVCDEDILWFTGGPRCCAKHMPSIDLSKMQAAKCATITNTEGGHNVILAPVDVLAEVGFKVASTLEIMLNEPSYALAYLVDKVKKHGFAHPETQKALFDVYEVHRHLKLP